MDNALTRKEQIDATLLTLESRTGHGNTTIPASFPCPSRLVPDCFPCFPPRSRLVPACFPPAIRLWMLYQGQRIHFTEVFSW